MKVIKQIGRFKILAVLALAMAAGAFLVAKLWAGSPHYVGAAITSCSGDTLTISAKEAGLGDETQINVTITATALCINGGQHNPKAANKTTVTGTVVVPVQNGKADYTLQVTAAFQPPCNPPMTVVFTDVTLTDTVNNLVQSNLSCP
jgi:hypothetical protein